MLGGNAEFLAKTDMEHLGYSDELISEATGFAQTDNEEILEAREKYSELYKKHKEKISAEADEVRALGGLYIMGTERHESRRIDNQLRGRAGRQGDVGASRFYISLEDDLMRLFGSERLMGIFTSLGFPEGEAIEHKMLSDAVEKAQTKIEGNHYGMRKNVLEYDQVMNEQREIMYAERRRVLEGEDMHDVIFRMIRDTVSNHVHMHIPVEIAVPPPAMDPTPPTNWGPNNSPAAHVTIHKTANPISTAAKECPSGSTFITGLLPQ